MTLMSSNENAAMVAWLRDYLRRERKADTPWRDLARKLGLKHPYLHNILNNEKRKSLGAGAQQAVADTFFDGSQDEFRRAAIEKFGSNIVHLPQSKTGQIQPRRYLADPAALKAARKILLTERGIKTNESIDAVAPFTYFASEQDAMNVVLVTNALYEAIKGVTVASPADDREPDHDSVATPRR